MESPIMEIVIENMDWLIEVKELLEWVTEVHEVDEHTQECFPDCHACKAKNLLSQMSMAI